MLGEYGLKATFYISPDNHEFTQGDLLTSHQIRGIADHFEIGAHTLTHRSLPTISISEAETEIVGSKMVLEYIVGSPVNTFCYPRGAYTGAHVQLVKAAGYRYARTVARYKFGVKNPYEAGTSLHIYNHGSAVELWRTAKFARFHPVAAWRYLEWSALGRAMFDNVVQQGGIFHVWGHSWEIDRNDDWQPLEDFFRYISAHPRVRYATNGELEAYLS